MQVTILDIEIFYEIQVEQVPLLEYFIKYISQIFVKIRVSVIYLCHMTKLPIHARRHTVFTKKVYTCVKCKYSRAKWTRGKVGGVCGTAPTFHLAPSVLSTRLDKTGYSLLGETVRHLCPTHW